jgi:predicted ester cyclase
VLQVRYEVHDVVAAGDTVAIRATAHGVNAIAPQGIDPTGKPMAMKTAHFFRARDGKLSEHWGHPRRTRRALSGRRAVAARTRGLGGHQAE